MPTLSITKTYATATVPYEADLDNIKDGVELFVNTTKLNSSNIAAKGVIGTNLNSNAVTYAKLATTTKNYLPPIGTILPWYSFSATLDFSTTYYAYCDGTSATITGLGSMMLPDMSDRFLVGFGTEGAGDQNTATWATAAAGNISHTNSLTHQHGPGSFKFQVWNMYGFGAESFWQVYAATGSAVSLMDVDYTFNAGNSTTAALLTIATETTTTNYYSYEGSGETGDQNTGSYDLQPRSIRVRYIMRIT